MDSFDRRFGMEVELTGISRYQAANLVRDCLTGSSMEYDGGPLHKHVIFDQIGREWVICRDASITPKLPRGKAAAIPDHYKGLF